ncbi:unknown function [Klebsiella phage vB_Kpl_K59PH2]|uniref:Uncharacterized protein n=1 Tax=Klebsiella phage vB_Kpl_K59PH2 TaxID=3071671 RepID=A0AAD2GR17_9CAUD|nr:unknown function [Klebsiella phage vB_Kpl_K59PH2]
MPLVNSRTPNAVPDEQHQGNYQIKPVSVFMYEEGVSVDTLSAVEVGELLRYYGVDSVAGLPPIEPKEPALAGDNTPRKTTLPPVFATPYGLPQGEYDVTPKVVRKRATAASGPVVLDATLLLLKGLSTEQAEHVFKTLAEQLGYDIQ